MEHSLVAVPVKAKPCGGALRRLDRPTPCSYPSPIKTVGGENPKLFTEEKRRYAAKLLVAGKKKGI